MKISRLTCVAALALTGATQAQIVIQPYKYSVTYQQAFDLGSLGGGQSEARDINDGGDIVGWATDASNSTLR